MQSFEQPLLISTLVLGLIILGILIFKTMRKNEGYQPIDSDTFYKSLINLDRKIEENNMKMMRQIMSLSRDVGLNTENIQILKKTLAPDLKLRS